MSLLRTITCPTQLIHPYAKVPESGSDMAAGYDIRCVAGLDGLENQQDFSAAQLAAWYRFGIDEHVTVQPGESFLFRTGFKQSIDPDYVCLLWDRSGMSVKKGMHKCAGVIDPDYVGEWFVCLTNHSDSPQTIHAGDKIVQGIYQLRVKAEFPLTDSLKDTARGSGGFGSTDSVDVETPEMLLSTVAVPAPTASEYLSALLSETPHHDSEGYSESADVDDIDDVAVADTPKRKRSTYDGVNVASALANLRDKQYAGAVAWMERDIAFFAGDVPKIIPSSLETVRGRQAISFEYEA